MRWLLLLLVLVMGCRKADIASDTRPRVVDIEAGPSLYALSMKLVDQDGRAIDLDVWRGHPVLVGMFYASCPNACPLFVSTIQGLERSLDERERADVRVLLVSFDPDDTPAMLSELAKKHHVDTKRWCLATGTSDDTRSLAAALDVKFRKLPDGNFNHSSPLVLAGRDGAMYARVEAIGDATDGFAERLHTLSR